MCGVCNTCGKVNMLHIKSSSLNLKERLIRLIKQYLSDQIKENDMAGIGTCVGKVRKSYRDLLMCTENIPLGRLRYKQRGNIKVDLKQVRCKEVEWCNLAEYMDKLCPR